MNFLLLGQPNVGKSSIFNILINKNKNIIHSNIGTTRDWHFSNIKNYPGLFIYDSPGLIIEKNKINLKQFKYIINKIDIFIYVIDYKNDSNFIDNEVINILRKFNKEIVIFVNKDDNLNKLKKYDNFGISSVYYLSCSHNLGFDDLFEYFSGFNKSLNIDLNYDFSLAIFGKPNAGKSTLLNNILGFKRSNTNKIAGTTSDLVEDIFEYRKKKFKILDTAGINKKSHINKSSLDYFAIKKTINSINKVDMSLLVIDSNDGLDRQSKRIFNLLINKSKSVLIIFSKIDLIKEKSKFAHEMNNKLLNEISSSKNISLEFITSFKANHISKIKKIIYDKTFKNNTDISTNQINLWLKNASYEYPHPLIKGKKVNFKYATQIKSHPIIIKIFSNFSYEIKKNYKSYLINNFNNHFKIKDSKVKMIFTTSNNPYN
tara:strand:+ start:3311 stop:4600 length:1290 start_codon:yes stop_codon:yes gene_type:complete